MLLCSIAVAGLMDCAGLSGLERVADAGGILGKKGLFPNGCDESKGEEAGLAIGMEGAP